MYAKIDFFIKRRCFFYVLRLCGYPAEKNGQVYIFLSGLASCPPPSYCILFLSGLIFLKYGNNGLLTEKYIIVNYHIRRSIKRKCLAKDFFALFVVAFSHYFRVLNWALKYHVSQWKYDCAREFLHRRF